MDKQQSSKNDSQDQEQNYNQINDDINCIEDNIQMINLTNQNQNENTSQNNINITNNNDYDNEEENQEEQKEKENIPYEVYKQNKGDKLKQEQLKLFEEDLDDLEDFQNFDMKMFQQVSSDKIDQQGLNDIRNQFNSNYDQISQVPGGYQQLGDLEEQLNQIDILSVDFQSLPGSISDAQSIASSNNSVIKTFSNAYTPQQSTITTKETGQSIKPNEYISEAIKNKMDALILDFQTNLSVLSHQKLVFMWVAVRLYEKSNVKLWKELKENYKKRVIMKRYCDFDSFTDSLEIYKSHSIILMISGYCGEYMIPKIYNNYRFKGIIVLTDKRGMPFNENWVKKYARIVLLTCDKVEAKNKLNQLINNTLFRGACKFYDLDHFLGKYKPLESYFLKNKKDLVVNEEQYNKKNNNLVKKLESIEEEKEENEENIKNLQKQLIENSKTQKKYVYVEKELQYLNQRRKLQFQKKQLLQDQKYVETVEQDDSLFILQDFSDIKDTSKQYFYNILQECKQIVISKKVIIRMDMFEDKSLDHIAEKFSEIYNIKNISNEERVEKFLNFYTQNKNDFYAIINCSLNTLNEDFIFKIQDMIKTIRYCHQQFDDKDALFQKGNIVQLYRGCTFNKKYFQNYFKPGQHLVFPAFTSTSTDENQALIYGKQGTEKRIIFKIECVCDDQFLKIRPKNLKNISCYPEESEYLMNCFSLLYIDSIDPDYKNDDGNGGYLLYNLKLLQ